MQIRRLVQVIVAGNLQLWLTTHHFNLLQG